MRVKQRKAKAAAADMLNGPAYHTFHHDYKVDFRARSYYTGYREAAMAEKDKRGSVDPSNKPWQRADTAHESGS